MKLITLYAKRVDTSVHLLNEDGTLKVCFPVTGYRPTRRTRIVIVNCFRFLVEWV